MSRYGLPQWEMRMLERDGERIERAAGLVRSAVGASLSQAAASGDVPPLSGHPPAPSVRALFAGFFGIGIIGFGGVLPWARRMIVEQRQWLSATEFTDLLALCQFLPGPNIVNMAVAIGARFRGLIGSVAAVTGLLAAPMVIVIALGGIYERYEHVPTVARAFGGLAAAASGLVVAMAGRIAAPQRDHWAGIAVAVVTFAAVALLRTPLLPTMLVMAPVSILLCRRFPR
jgi:chromate transporter